MKRIVIILTLFVAAFAACKKETKKTLAVISTNSATSITSTSAVVGGTISNTGGTTITQSGICYALNSNPTLSDSLVSASASGTGSYTATLSNLNSNTTYYYRAYATNGTGTALGAVDSFVTSQGTATITTSAITNNQALTAQSGGTITNNGGAAVTAKGICWSTSMNPTISSSKTVDAGTGNAFSDTLTNLTLGVTYYVRAYATNSFGTGYGNQISFTVSSTGTVTDIDGNTYGTITIGTQTWTTSNLRVRHYRNGDPIEDGYTGVNLDTTSVTGIFTFANKDTTTASSYGLYYNFGAVTDSRNITPSGWHVPTDADWYVLEFYEGLKSSDTTTNHDVGFRGTIGGKFLAGGSSGLNLQLPGIYCPSCGGYSGFKSYGIFLSSSVAAKGSVWMRGFNVTGSTAPIWRTYATYIGTVRLIKD